MTSTLISQDSQSSNVKKMNLSCSTSRTTTLIRDGGRGMPQIYQRNTAAFKMETKRWPVTAGTAKTVTTAKVRRLEALVSCRRREISWRA